jgi:hypothetical protein
VIVGRRGERSRGPVARYQPGVSLTIAALVLPLLAVSLWTVFETSSPALVLAWTGVWAFTSGVVGWFKQSWLWAGLCPVTMLATILVWVAIFGHSYWASAFLTVLGAMFAVAATIGALIGTWLGKRPTESG